MSCQEGGRRLVSYCSIVLLTPASVSPQMTYAISPRLQLAWLYLATYKSGSLSLVSSTVLYSSTLF